jgi:hypothetical protein
LITRIIVFLLFFFQALSKWLFNREIFSKKN